MLTRAYPPSRQRGAILVITALLIVVLVGIAALALDIGRVLTLRTEMQNAADAAALAGAAELDGKAGAQERATAAARNLLQHYGHHDISDAELLGDALQDATYPGGRKAIEFFCYIGSEHDVEDVCTGEQIDDDGDGVVGDKVRATNSADTHYIRVNLLPDAAANGESYTVQLYFLPVLSLVTGDPKGFQEVSASALAGRHFRMCNYPPVAICDPFEGGVEGANNFEEAVDLGLMSPGGEIVLKLRSGENDPEGGGSGNWAPGNAGLLAPRIGADNYETGAKKTQHYLASPCAQGCTPAIVQTAPGQTVGPVNRAINTYFDAYPHPEPDDLDKLKDDDVVPTNYPPAPSVIEYPRDNTYHSWGDGRFGTGDWNRKAYRDSYHAYIVGTTVHYDPGFEDENLNGMTRWEVYNHEISSGYMPRNPKGTNNVAGDGDDLPSPDPNPRQVWPQDGINKSYVDPWLCYTKGNNRCPDPEKKDPITGQYYTELGWIPGLGDPEVSPPGYPAGYLPEGLAAPNHLNLEPGEPTTCDAIAAGADADPPRSVPDRRILYTAVIQCEAQGVRGSSKAVAVGTFAKLFVLRRAGADGDGTQEKADIVTEFVELVDDQDAEYHVDVQLYE